MNWQSHYSQCLKALSAAFCIASAILAAGCADPLEKPITQEAGEKFKRGITGGGTLVPIDPANDPSTNPPGPDPSRP
ncbi:MAG TPA: hypothetical protein VGW39_02005 [Chthoniobacterales bacterium]|nr:hypothetical protein [Chthoniobacterales bacterium]